jgi:hypothetical protein
MKNSLWLLALISSALVGTASAKVSPEEAAKLGTTLTPVGAERAGNKDGSLPEWKGDYKLPKPAAGQERLLSSSGELGKDKPLYTITAANLEKYKAQLTLGHQTLLKKFPDTYKMNVYKSRRTATFPDFIVAATKKNALEAEATNGGESLSNAITGIPFPIPKSGIEVMWNHKTRFRGVGVTRYNIQMAVTTGGDFTPFKLKEDVRFHYNLPNQTPAQMENVIIYFLQLTMDPPRQAGSVLLVHETADQIKEARRAWLYNPGQRRVRRAPNVAYDNPGNGSDGLRTNDQLDVFNGATDRYTWKIVGKKEMIIPYNNAILGQNSLKYSDIAKKNHMNQDLPRYELHRVWVVEAELKPGTSHIYSKRTFYVEEDTWTAVHADMYDRRGQLWRVQEAFPVNIPWRVATGNAGGTSYDLQSGRYLLLEFSNEEPFVEDKVWEIAHFDPSNVAKEASR